MNYAKHPNWQPLTHAASKPDPDPRAQPIPFTLDPEGRHSATMARMELERRRRELDKPEEVEPLPGIRWEEA